MVRILTSFGFYMVLLGCVAGFEEDQESLEVFLQSCTNLTLCLFFFSAGKWHGSDPEQTTGSEHSSAQLLLMAPGKTQPHIQLAQRSNSDAHLQLSQCFSSSSCAFIAALFSCSVLFPHRLPFNLHHVLFHPMGARHLLCPFDPFQHIF